jgi:nucleoid DNA-binding protein
MNTTSLINLTAEETGQTKAQTAATLEAALKIIRVTVASGKPVILPDFGTFKVCHVFDKDEINPEAEDPVSDVRAVKFLPSQTFRAEVNHRS